MLDAALGHVQRAGASNKLGSFPAKDSGQIGQKPQSDLLGSKQEWVTTSMLVCLAPKIGGWIAPPSSSSLRPENQGREGCVLC